MKSSAASVFHIATVHCQQEAITKVAVNAADHRQELCICSRGMEFRLQTTHLFCSVGGQSVQCCCRTVLGLMRPNLTTSDAAVQDDCNSDVQTQ